MSDSIRILHVDDDPSFREMTAKFLRQESDQFDLVGESHGTDAREQVMDTDEEIDCVVSDYALPGINGVKLLEAVRNEYPDCPFILFTGKGSEAIARDALRAGATDYLQKRSGTEQYDLLANRVRNAVEQSRANRRITELERVRTLVADINQALVHGTSKREIETDVCELFVESEPYVTACIAGVDTETMRIEPRAWAGADQAYFEQLDMAVTADASGRQAPEGRAYHDREIAVSQDIENDPRYEQWRDAALEQGFASLAVVPLEYDTELYGLFAIFASHLHAFGEAEREVLTELGDDIAHALHNQAVEAELERTTREFRTVFDHIPAGTMLVDYDDGTFRYRRVNPRMEELSGLSDDKIRNKTPQEAFGVDDGEVVEARYRECVERGEPVEYTAEFEIPGEQVVRRGTAVPVGDGKRIEYLVVIVQDITEQVRRERERERSERYRRKLYEITSSDRDDRQKLQQLLELGCDRLDVENGHIARIERETNRHEIELAGGSDFVRAGIVTDLNSTYCRETADSDDILTVYNAPAEGWGDDPAYERWDIGCYIGGCIEADDEFYGTLCFVNRSPRERDFSQTERTFVDLMTRWVSHVLGRQQHRQHLRQYEAVIDTVPDGVYILNDSLEFTMVNDGLAELTGYSRDELVGSHASLVFDEETIENGQRNRDRLRNRRSEHEYLSTDIKTASGDTVPCEIRESLLDPDTEEPVTTVGVIRDVTEQGERKREQIISRVTDAIVEVDADWQFTLVNEQAEELCDMQETDLLGRSFWDVFTEARGTRFEDKYRAAMETREPMSLVDYYAGLDGWFDIQVYPIDDGGVAFYFQEIIERQRQQRRLEEFASDISHDLRNPLNIIDGRLELAKRECGSEHLVDAEVALDRCQALVDDLLTLAREGQRVGETEPVRLADILDGCWKTIEPDEATLNHDIDWTILADRSRLKQLFENLFRNATDHAGPAVVVEVGRLDDGFYVADNGPGIPGDIRDEVFQSAYSTVEDNTGFGLAIVKRIVDAHGWDITVRESASAGARFEITGVETP